MGENQEISVSTMCACRIEELKSARGTYDLDDYIYEMETRAAKLNDAAACGGADAEDVYAQLAQKEKDLVLAAELGKALLEKNEELSVSNERMLDDFTHKVEHLEQEKHALRRKLDAVEGEYESKVLELQSDILLLRKELEQQQQSMGMVEKEKSMIMDELTEQNQRLTTQLKQVSHAEEQLSSQLKYLKEQFNLRKTNIHDHVNQLEMLREEINMMTEKKAELERRIENMVEERDGMNQAIDESSDRIVMLEKHNKDKEFQVRNQERDLEELRQTNSQLQEKIEMLTRRSSTPASLCHTSLLNEIEMSEDEARSLSNGHFGRSRHLSQLNSSLSFPNDIEDDDEIECDDAVVPNSGSENEELQQLKQELLDIYHQLRLMCEQLQQRRGSMSSASSSSEEMISNQMRAGMLTDVLKELRGLLHDILRKEAKGVCLTCGQGLTDREEFEREFVSARANVEKLNWTIEQKNNELRKKSEEVMDLSSKLSIQQAELIALHEEKSMLKSDLESTDLSHDEVVKKAWEVRDQAVTRKNSLEVELAKTRIEIMNSNSQLIEAIQQKLELSQQLEQWQMDMETLLGHRIKKKLHQSSIEDGTAESDTSSNASMRSKILSLWRR